MTVKLTCHYSETTITMLGCMSAPRPTILHPQQGGEIPGSCRSKSTVGILGNWLDWSQCNGSPLPLWKQKVSSLWAESPGRTDYSIALRLETQVLSSSVLMMQLLLDHGRHTAPCTSAVFGAVLCWASAGGGCAAGSAVRRTRAARDSHHARAGLAAGAAPEHISHVRSCDPHQSPR